MYIRILCRRISNVTDGRENNYTFNDKHNNTPSYISLCSSFLWTKGAFFFSLFKKKKRGKQGQENVYAELLFSVSIQARQQKKQKKTHTYTHWQFSSPFSGERIRDEGKRGRGGGGKGEYRGRRGLNKGSEGLGKGIAIPNSRWSVVPPTSLCCCATSNQLHYIIKCPEKQNPVSPIPQFRGILYSFFFSTFLKSIFFFFIR